MVKHIESENIEINSYALEYDKSIPHARWVEGYS